MPNIELEVPLALGDAEAPKPKMPVPTLNGVAAVEVELMITKGDSLTGSGPKLIEPDLTPDGTESVETAETDQN